MTTSPNQGTALDPAATKPRTAPLWHVVLLDDDDHTYEYVIEMLGAIFHYDARRGFRLAKEVDQAGRAILETTVFERAEWRQEQIHGYGADWRIERCQGSMRCVLEPAPA